MEEKLYTYDTLFTSAIVVGHTPQDIMAKNNAKESLRKIMLDKNIDGFSILKGSETENAIFFFLRREEEENGIRYLFNEDGSFVKTVTTSVFAEVKAFIEQENQTRGGNMTSEECFTMAVCFFKGVQSQQKNGWREVTETDLSKILSEIVTLPAKRKGR